MMSTIKANIVQTRTALMVTFLMALGGLAFLSVVATGQSFTQIDLTISEWVQSIHFSGLDTFASIVSFASGTQVAIALWLIATIFLVMRGRPLEAIVVIVVPGFWIANQLFGVVVDRPAVSGELGAVDFTRERSGSFPSGHVTGAAVFYGILAVLIFSNFRRGRPRLFAAIAAATIIGLVSLSRVYVGAHWPSDVLGSYLFSFVGVGTIAWAYISIKNDRFSIPRIRRKKTEPEVAEDGIKIAGSIASKVYLDSNAGTATKEYHPPFAIRALYWLAFQAPFPYKARKDALEAAAAKRKIAGFLTTHRFGKDMVASVYEIRDGDGTYGFVTELVPGAEPESNREVEELLREYYSFFQEIGFPTWQISPANPHAYSNFIRNPEGELKLIDLESAIVSFSLPFKEFRAALRDGHYPAFDDVDFVQLRRYIDANSLGLRQSLGDAGLKQLREATDTAQERSHTWRHSEPRIWGRLGQRIYKVFDWSRLFNRIGKLVDGGESIARSFLNSAIDRWEQEGRVDAEHAAEARERLESPEVRSLLKHLGAHFALSLALRFPFGSLSRFGWVLSFRLKARSNFKNGTITREQYVEARSVHTIPVMLLGLIPGFGTIAYFASGTVRKSGIARMLTDQFAYKLPFKLYTRLHLARVTAPRMASPTGPSYEKNQGVEEAPATVWSSTQIRLQFPISHVTGAVRLSRTSTQAAEQPTHCVEC